MAAGYICIYNFIQLYIHIYPAFKQRIVHAVVSSMAHVRFVDLKKMQFFFDSKLKKFAPATYSAFPMPNNQQNTPQNKVYLDQSGSHAPIQKRPAAQASSSKRGVNFHPSSWKNIEVKKAFLRWHKNLYGTFPWFNRKKSLLIISDKLLENNRKTIENGLRSHLNGKKAIFRFLPFFQKIDFF